MRGTNMSEEKIIEMNGKVASIDLVKKALGLKDELGVIHYYKWDTEPLQEYFAKQKVGFYQTVKYLPNTYLIKGAHYWPEGKDVFAKLDQGQGKFPPRKPRYTMGFTIAIAQYENVKLEVEGASPDECKQGLIALMDTIAPGHEPTREMVQKFKTRVFE
jgi:hypothetical protein